MKFDAADFTWKTSGLDTEAEMERLYRRIIALETLGKGMLAGPYAGSVAASVAYTSMCTGLGHPANEYKPGHCYCTAKER